VDGLDRALVISDDGECHALEVAEPLAVERLDLAEPPVVLHRIS
jgi:hypothetical protein